MRYSLLVQKGTLVSAWESETTLGFQFSHLLATCFYEELFIPSEFQSPPLYCWFNENNPHFMQIWSSDEMLSAGQSLECNYCYDYVSVLEGLEPNLLYLLYQGQHGWVIYLMSKYAVKVWIWPVWVKHYGCNNKQDNVMPVFLELRACEGMTKDQKLHNTVIINCMGGHLGAMRTCRSGAEHRPIGSVK